MIRVHLISGSQECSGKDLWHCCVFCSTIDTMVESGNFDRLVSSLTLNERLKLLEKLKAQSNFSTELLYIEDKVTIPMADIKTEYAKLPWYYRLWYFIKGLFMSKIPVDIFWNHQVSGLANKIELKSPGLYDYQKNLLLPPFYRLLGRLKEASRFFYSALDTSVNRDRGSFFAFLASLEMPEIHTRLQDMTDPKKIMEKNPDIEETELRQLALKAMDDTMSIITADQRGTLYHDARSLFCLKELSSFLFDRALTAFTFNPAFNGETCSANVLRDHLANLNNILFSLKLVPPMPLLKSLLIFLLQERAAEPGFEINRELSMLLTKAEESLGNIREFNKIVPLSWIIRCSSRDMSLSPREISGGEDWFMVYRDYWKKRTESQVGAYIKENRQRELLETFRNFLKGKNLKMLENVQSESNQHGLPIKEAFALSFLNSFYSGVFMPEMNKLLRPILIDGEFLKKENRIEYAEAYNTLIKLEDEIIRFDKKLSVEGDYGERYNLARSEMTSLPIKRRKIQLVLDEAHGDASRILEQARSASRTMVNTLSGILGNNPKAKYDSLVNLTKFTAKESQFYSEITEIIKQFQTVSRLLDEIETMEMGR